MTAHNFNVPDDGGELKRWFLTQLRRRSDAAIVAVLVVADAERYAIDLQSDGYTGSIGDLPDWRAVQRGLRELGRECRRYSDTERRHVTLNVMVYGLPQDRIWSLRAAWDVGYGRAMDF